LMVFIIGFFLVKPGIGVGEAPKAEFLLQWGKKGPGSGEFNQPIGIKPMHTLASISISIFLINQSF